MGLGAILSSLVVLQIYFLAQVGPQTGLYGHYSLMGGGQSQAHMFTKLLGQIGP